jgi:uncharacterized protein (TIGR03435 family)
MQLRIEPAALLVLANIVGFAQEARPRIEFTTAAIRPTSGQPSVLPDGKRVYGAVDGGPGSSDEGTFAGNGVTLTNLILAAYSVKVYQVSGPDWIRTTRYDISAKVPAGATKEELNLMLQSMLEKKFSLKLHRETKEFPAYNLVVAEGGLKLKDSLPIDDCSPGTRLINGICPDGPIPVSGIAKSSDDGPTGISSTFKKERWISTGRRVTMSRFARNLEAQFYNSVVTDETGLTDAYDFRFEFVSPTSSALATASPSLFTALEREFGLKLEFTKAMLDVLFIDHIEQPRD